MRMKIVTLLCAGQIAALANPALAADLLTESALNSAPQTQHGAFVGMRLRLPLGAADERPQAGVALTSVQRDRESTALRFSKGFEFGFSGGRHLGLYIAGQPFKRSYLGIGASGEAPAGRRNNLSTIGWVAIGLGATAAIVLAATAYADDHCPDSIPTC